MKVCRGLAQPRTFDDAPDIGNVSQDIDDGPSINEESKEMEVGPGEKVSVVGFLCQMGRSLSVIER